jgi:hypothetical protein
MDKGMIFKSLPLFIKTLRMILSMICTSILIGPTFKRVSTLISTMVLTFLNLFTIIALSLNSFVREGNN